MRIPSAVIVTVTVSSTSGPPRIRQAEVENLHPPVIRDEQVAGLDVAMHHAARVRRREAARDLPRVLGGLPRGKGAALEPLRQRLPLEDFGDDEGGVGLDADVVDRKDVGMIQPARGARLLFEPAPAHGVAGELRGKHLEGDVALQLRIARAIHLSHASCAKGAEDLETAESIPYRERHVTGKPGL